MIEVSVRKDGITVSGHAGYAETGKDIVCAGVTALIQTLIKSVNDLTEDKIQYEIMPGWADIHFRDLSEESKFLVDSFFLGVCNIANEFPDHVRIM
ncbi:ribosomal-processing cysteine protease Prp [Sellimonas intestinalis]|nr:ribosomal-processing cysteine protease Prp [Sellimonas intestinalis]MBA2215241.1 ribosomal-processing cysteine protease Prp [Sellimonas intestinalis]